MLNFKKNLTLKIVEHLA